MKTSYTLFLLGALILAACNGATPGSNEAMHGEHMEGAEISDLRVLDASTDEEIAFTVLEGSVPFIDYGISHTKEMHLIVVRDDLRHFAHLHPTRDAEGVWRTLYAAPAGGTYWLYADFADRDGNTHTIRFLREYAGDRGPYGIMKDLSDTREIDGYVFELPPVPTVGGDTLSFTYFIEDAKGMRIQPEEYLGAVGHSILVSPNGDFVHAHPEINEHGDPQFLVPMPSENFYRVFTQFKIKGDVLVAEFDWEQ